MMQSSVIVFVCLVISFSFACYPNGQQHGRPRHQGLSDKEPGSKQYDQDAFLGRDLAKEFRGVSSEESLRKLALIARRIDTDGNELISNSELTDWLNKTHVKYIISSSDVHFTDLDDDGDASVTWTQYDIKTYGFIDSKMYEVSHDEHSEIDFMRKRDKQRWNFADVDKDGRLTKVEYRAFIYPEEFDHTRPNYVRETMLQVDKNQDDKLDFTEYINDLLTPEDQQTHPDWVDAEKLQFYETRDVDKDGYLDIDEVTGWLFPIFNEVMSEAKHLIEVSDTNKDGELDLREILANHDTFAGSKATEWGEALKNEL